jgi:type VI secretion system protein ImpE
VNANELYKAGQLPEAIEEQLKEVKAHAGDQSKRLFLFELLAFAGDLERARRQIGVLNYTEPELVMAVHAYDQLLTAEEARRKLFGNGQAPQFLAPAPEHVSLRLKAVDLLRQGQSAEAAATIAKADAAAPAVTGQLNGKPFSLFRDCDDLFGPVLEVMAKGKYFWVPLEQIDSLALSAPKFPRDLLWLTGHLAVREGPEGDVFLPTLYPNSHDSPDNDIKLGRKTDWSSEAPVRGVGLRTYIRDDDAIGILELRELTIS